MAGQAPSAYWPCVVPACSLDDAGRDRPARLEGLVVAEELVLAAQVSHACVRAGSLASRQAGGGGLGGDRGGGPAAAAGQYREPPASTAAPASATPPRALSPPISATATSKPARTTPSATRTTRWPGPSRPASSGERPSPCTPSSVRLRRTRFAPSLPMPLTGSWNHALVRDNALDFSERRRGFTPQARWRCGRPSTRPPAR